MKFNGNLVLAVLTVLVVFYMGYSQFNMVTVRANSQCNCANNSNCNSGQQCQTSGCTVCVDCYPGGFAGMCE